jgi:hypothetical protein
MNQEVMSMVKMSKEVDELDDDVDFEEDISSPAARAPSATADTAEAAAEARELSGCSDSEANLALLHFAEHKANCTEVF